MAEECLYLLQVEVAYFSTVAFLFAFFLFGGAVVCFFVLFWCGFLLLLFGVFCYLWDLVMVVLFNSIISI